MMISIPTATHAYHGNLYPEYIMKQNAMRIILKSPLHKEEPTPSHS